MITVVAYAAPLARAVTNAALAINLFIRMTDLLAFFRYQRISNGHREVNWN